MKNNGFVLPDHETLNVCSKRWSEFKDDEQIDACAALVMDMGGSSGLATIIGTEKAHIVKEHFRQLVSSTSQRWGAFHEQGDSGDAIALLFLNNEHMTGCAIEIQSETLLLRQKLASESQILANIPSDIARGYRMAGHNGPIIFNRQIGKCTGIPLDVAGHALKKCEAPGFFLSKAIHDSLTDKQRELFKGGPIIDHETRHIEFVEMNSVVQTDEGIDLLFGGINAFLRDIKEMDKQEQFSEIVKAAIRVCKLAALTFIAATYRYYEPKIIDETRAGDKKFRSIKQVLAQSFGQPGLTTLQKLARSCYHLVDDNASTEVIALHAMMAANPILGPIGDLLDSLEKVFPAPRHHVRIVNKSKLRKPIMEYLLPEIGKYESRIADKFEMSATDVFEDTDVDTWRSALLALVDCFAPLQSLAFRIRTIERVRNDSDEFDVLVTTYRHQAISVECMTQVYKDRDDNRMETYELLLADGKGETALDLFPFIVIRKDRLNYYTRTRARGYQYNAVFDGAGHVVPTKRKFGQLVLHRIVAADLQGLFWTQVIPTVSELGVRANYPAHGAIVGRKQQIKDIMEQIIEIPNQNGIVYGPGGVGKTALLIELSRQLFEETSSPNFKNIIWVSAKANFYEPILDEIEERQPQFQSLDNILGAILEFHEFEDANTYNSDEKKWLVLELLQDERTLLILDNFETVPRVGQADILKFFGLTAKRALISKPDYFTVIITSRELIPSGFHQINLKGLDKEESIQLMQRLYDPYKRSGREQLTEHQQTKLYESTKGIPLIIKHCYGQIYEYGSEIDHVLNRLSTAGTRVVDFSFAEIFGLIKQDAVQLQVILLLELNGSRLMARQMADILGIEESEIAARLVQLVNFQCINIVSAGIEVKYGLNDELRLLTRRLTLEYATLATEIKRRIAGLTLDKRMDYTKAEFDAVLAFKDYISQGHFILAEDFMREQLRERPSSLLLNLHYAKYLKEAKRRTQEAIDRLKSILAPSGYDQQVLRLLMSYYTDLEVPNFEQAYSYARELEGIESQDKEIKAEIAKFYVAWSTGLKLKLEMDPLKEMLRQQKYKELANAAITLLKRLNLAHLPQDGVE